MGKLKKKMELSQELTPVFSIDWMLDQVKDLHLDEKEVEIANKFVDVYREQYDEGGIEQVKAFITQNRQAKASIQMKKHLEQVALGNASMDKSLQTKAEDAVAATLLLKIQELVNSVDLNKINDASLRDITSSLGVLFDRYRVSQDKSTANISVSTVGALISRISEKEVTATVIDPEESIPKKGIENV